MFRKKQPRSECDPRVLDDGGRSGGGGVGAHAVMLLNERQMRNFLAKKDEQRKKSMPTESGSMQRRKWSGCEYGGCVVAKKKKKYSKQKRKTCRTKKKEKKTTWQSISLHTHSDADRPTWKTSGMKNEGAGSKWMTRLTKASTKETKVWATLLLCQISRQDNALSRTRPTKWTSQLITEEDKSDGQPAATRLF